MTYSMLCLLSFFLSRKRKFHLVEDLIIFTTYLTDSTAEESVQASQMKLKRARLADNLNEKIALRPGPLELVEKNIIPIDSAVKEAIKGNFNRYLLRFS